MTSLFLLHAAATALVSTLMTFGLVRVLKRGGVLDVPNERSLHVSPTPRGGGWGILLAFVAAAIWTGMAAAHLTAVAPIVAGSTLLLGISARDDRRALSPLPRFGAQLVAVAVGLTVLNGRTFQGLLPGWLDAGLTAFVWLWFINLFNFMDGMDGLAGGEALAICVGLYAAGPDVGPAAALLGGAVLGFLVWNWSPAKIFLGDVGSIPLGYLLGAMLLWTAQRGHWAVSLVLPAYFLADATITLLKRIARRERIWQAHRTHFYQRAVRGGRTHGQVAGVVMVANAALVACAAVLASTYPLLAIATAGVLVALLLTWMNRAAPAS